MAYTALGRRKRMSEINVVPYIDVMLVFIGDFYGNRAIISSRRGREIALCASKTLR